MLPLHWWFLFASVAAAPLSRSTPAPLKSKTQTRSFSPTLMLTASFFALVTLLQNDRIHDANVKQITKLIDIQAQLDRIEHNDKLAKLKDIQNQQTLLNMQSQLQFQLSDIASQSQQHAEMLRDIKTYTHSQAINTVASLLREEIVGNRNPGVRSTTSPSSLSPSIPRPPPPPPSPPPPYTP